MFYSPSSLLPSLPLSLPPSLSPSLSPSLPISPSLPLSLPPPSQVKLYNEKRSDLEEQQLHLNVGLQKIRETVDQVEELQASLSIKKNELEQKNALANQKLRQMVRQLFISYCYFY